MRTLSCSAVKCGTALVSPAQRGLLRGTLFIPCKSGATYRATQLQRGCPNALTSRGAQAPTASVDRSEPLGRWQDSCNRAYVSKLGSSACVPTLKSWLRL